MSPTNPSSPVKNFDSIRDAHVIFVKTSRQLIDTTRRKINLVNDLSDEIRCLANQIKDERSVKAEDKNTEMSQSETSGNIEEETDVISDEKKKVNTKIKVVVPVCTEVIENGLKSHKRKSQKKNTTKGKKVTDDTKSSSTQSSCRLKASKSKKLDPIKYLQLVEGERSDRFELEKKYNPKAGSVCFSNVKTEIEHSGSVNRNSNEKLSTQTSEPYKNKEQSQCKLGNETRQRKTEKGELCLPAVVDKMANKTFCTISKSPNTITCENCLTKVICDKEQEECIDTVKNIGQTPDIERLEDETITERHAKSIHEPRENTNRTPCLSRHSRVFSSRSIVHLEMNQIHLDEIPNISRSKTCCRMRRHDVKPKTARQCRFPMYSSRNFRSDVYGGLKCEQMGFQPERCPKLSFYCSDELERKHYSDCCAHREVLRPNKVTLQSTAFPSVFSETSFLPIEEISIGFRFRLGRKHAFPLTLEPEYRRKSTRSVASSVYRSLQRSREIQSQF